MEGSELVQKKYFIYYLLILQFTISCKDQFNQARGINSRDVDEIIIENKVYRHTFELVRKKVIVNERVLINKIIGAINDAKPISHFDVRSNVNYGFFELTFFEGDEEQSYDILYTVYDGVVIRNGGECFKNDLLEIYVYKLFL